MKSTVFRLVVIISLLSIFALGLSAKHGESTREKIKPEVLIAKHLESIGKIETLKSIKSIMSAGVSDAVFSGRGGGVFQGRVVLASQDEKNMIGMKFSNPDYQYENMGYDGDKVTIGFSRPGVRSQLGNFFRNNQKTFQKGILGGVLTTSWELLNYDEKEGKLKYAGTSKKKGKKFYKFDYNIRKGSDLDVKLFFDVETFRHVKTEYKRVITAGLGTSVDNSSRQNETRHKLTEEFSDFRVENGLMMPHQYELSLEISGTNNVRNKWTMELQRFFFNQEIATKDFRMDAGG